MDNLQALYIINVFIDMKSTFSWSIALKYNYNISNVIDNVNFTPKTFIFASVLSRILICHRKFDRLCRLNSLEIHDRNTLNSNKNTFLNKIIL